MPVLAALVLSCPPLCLAAEDGNAVGRQARAKEFEWPMQHMKHLPADQLEMVRPSGTGRRMAPNSKIPTVLYIRQAIRNYLVGAHLEETNAYLADESLHIDMLNDKLPLFAPEWVRLYGLFNNRTG